MESVVNEYDKILDMREAEMRRRDSPSQIGQIIEEDNGRNRLLVNEGVIVNGCEFQRLFGPQGTLTDTLGLQNPTSPPTSTSTSPFLLNGLLGTSPTGCPTGATGCNPDPYFHIPNLDEDSGDCLYIPTFFDTPMTPAMAVYLVEALLKEVSPDTILEEIDNEVKKALNRISEGNLLFNYIPIGIIFIVLVWVMVIYGLFDWKAGLLLTFVIIAVFWLGYMLLDVTIREDTSKVATNSSTRLQSRVTEKNDSILGNIIKAYYTATNHMILPEAAICGDSPTGSTGTFGDCGCFDTGFQFTVADTEFEAKIPLPSLIINDQIKTGGDLRCVGIDNSKTLLPAIENSLPCLEGVDGFDISRINNTDKEAIAECVLDSLPDSLTNCGSGTSTRDKLECLAISCEDPEKSAANPAVCSLVSQILECTGVL